MLVTNTPHKNQTRILTLVPCASISWLKAVRGMCETKSVFKVLVPTRILANFYIYTGLIQTYKRAIYASPTFLKLICNEYISACV